MESLEERINNAKKVGHWKKALESKHNCESKNCPQNAINSHIIQKNRILDKISERGKVIISEVDMFDFDSFPFKEIGLKNALIFKGFCNEHDTILFRPIEQIDKIDYTNHDNLLLFNYRTLVNEKRRKENLITYWTSLIEDKSISVNNVELESEIKNAELDIIDIAKMLESLTIDLYSSPKSPKYTFNVYKTSRKEVCLSSLFTHKIDNKGNPHDIIINYFPINDKENILILGYPKTSEKECGPWSRSFRKKSEKEIFTEINKLLFRKCEMWACSKGLFETKIKPIEDKIQKLMKETASNQDLYADADVHFNILAN